MIFNMGSGMNSGVKIINLKVTIYMGKNMDKVLNSGLMDHLSMEITKIINFMDKVSIPGMMEENTMESGIKTKCTEKVASYGKMEESM